MRQFASGKHSRHGRTKTMFLRGGTPWMSTTKCMMSLIFPQNLLLQGILFYVYCAARQQVKTSVKTMLCEFTMEQCNSTNSWSGLFFHDVNRWHSTQYKQLRSRSSTEHKTKAFDYTVLNTTGCVCFEARCLANQHLCPGRSNISRERNAP